MSTPIETNSELFDVSTLFAYECYHGLFVDKNLHLWSRTSNGRYRRLANQWSLPCGEYPHSLTELRKNIANSRKFADFVKRIRAALTEHERKTTSLKGKFVIAIINDGLPMFPTNPQVFNTREEADIKLMHYKQIDPHSRFCLFECKGEVKSVGVVLE